MEFGIFTTDGRRVVGTKLYVHEEEALRDYRGYCEQYGFFVTVACNDHSDRPWEGCPEWHDDAADREIAAESERRNNAHLARLGSEGGKG